MVVVVEAVARLISGLVGMPGGSPHVVGLEVTAAVTALPAEESRAPMVPPVAVEGVIPLLPPRGAEVGLLTPEAFSAPRAANISSNACFSTLCLSLISSAHSCRCCLSCSQTFPMARSISTSTLSMRRLRSASLLFGTCNDHPSRTQRQTQCSAHLYFLVGLFEGCLQLLNAFLAHVCALGTRSNYRKTLHRFIG